MENIKKGKYKIAVIEDDEVMSKSISEELEDAGFEVIKALDGEEGLQLVFKEKPDLVLLDIVMPKMDGMTMLGKLRASESDPEYGHSVPVILLTNLNADDKIMREILRDEPAYYLVKSNWTVADVVAKVENCLGNSGQE